MRAKEFMEGDVVPFPTQADMSYQKYRDNLSDEERYAMAAADQHAAKYGEPDHMNPEYDPEIAADMEKLGGPYDDEMAAQDVGSMDMSPEELIDLLKRSGMKPIDIQGDMEEGSKENAEALVGSGRADPHGKKTNPDSKAHKAVRTPTTTYSKDRKKYNNGAPPGANDGFVGG